MKTSLKGTRNTILKILNKWYIKWNLKLERIVSIFKILTKSGVKF